MTTVKSKPSGSSAPRTLDPSACTPWYFHNRSELWLATPQAEFLKDSIENYGQRRPGVVRLVSSPIDTAPRYEIICGYRRWDACRLLGLPFNAQILPSDTSDQECAKLMEAYDEGSERISDLERARSYEKFLEIHIYDNIYQLAEHLELQISRVSRLLDAAHALRFLRKELYPNLETLIQDLNVPTTLRLSEGMQDLDIKDAIHRVLTSDKFADEPAPKKRITMLRKAMKPALFSTTIDINEEQKLILSKLKDGKTQLILDGIGATYWEVEEALAKAIPLICDG